ncbi:type VI lipase adapter Tla3 domain-containing protein [Pseudomonas silesiensis]|uniref:type VI lipase adapter Tla3 domain-containing protein n=1 Tax=Pseudomonas silesiensis TaxID=1853130 RepID=UPI0034D4D750
MRDRQHDKSQRPQLKGYFWAAGILSAVWLGFLFFVVYTAQVENRELRDMDAVMRWGIASILGALVLAYSGHWFGKALAYEKVELATYKSKVIAEVTEQITTRERTYALEIRGVGLAIDDWHQSSIWREINNKNSNFTSIYSQNPKDYDASLSSREITRSINVRVAFKHSASDSVAYWPIPVFAIAPPKQPEDAGAPNTILSGRNAATLGVTLFLWQDADNTTHAQNMIERLFQFFDDNPKVPQALVVSRDGDVTRNGYREAGTPGLQNVHAVPAIFESMTGLLVTRSDRIDSYIRPFATNNSEDNQNTNTDMGKLWAFYWNRDDAFLDWYKEGERAKGKKGHVRPITTMSSAYWQSQLPPLWQTLSNRGPGHFEPSPWLPVRWASHQVQEFDRAPILGYLHRPIKVPMQDENGKLLKPALQAKALQAGWRQALETLPDGDKPVRVFYDSTDNVNGEIALTHALHGLNVDGTGIELGNVDEGYDIGRRLGNTGVSGALVEINLATIASYQEGGVSAVVYSGKDGSSTVQMVRPPDEARKAKNQQTHGVDPFRFRMPGQ